METIEYIFSGRVQGVGFRYTIRQIAAKYPVKGYVKNQSNGTVKLLVQADENAIELFFSEIKRYFSENIRDVSKNIVTSAKNYSNFDIKY